MSDKCKMSDVFEKVSYEGLDRPEYILKNGKAFNIYAAFEYVQEQQDRIAELEKAYGEVTSAQYGLHPVKQLEQERDQLKAQNAKFKEALHYIATQSITALPGTGTHSSELSGVLLLQVLIEKVTQQRSLPLAHRVVRVVRADGAHQRTPHQPEQQKFKHILFVWFPLSCGGLLRRGL